MKVYLSNTKPENLTSKWANNLPMLDGVLLDSEGTDLTCDDFVSSFEINEIEALIKKLTIADVDSNILCRRAYNQEISENELNLTLFARQKRKSLLSLETLEALLPSNLEVESKTYEHKTCRFVLVVRRAK
jgi:hypothetical protein